MTTFLERFDRMRVNLPPVDAGRMKYFALVTMLIDHIAYCFLENVHTADNEALMYSLPQGSILFRKLSFPGESISMQMS